MSKKKNIISVRRGRRAARAYSEVAPLSGLSDMQKLKVYDQLREAHKFIKAIRDGDLLDDANDEQDSVVDAVDTIMFLAEGIFGRMSD